MEVIVRMKTDHVRVEGCEYVRDLVRCKACRHKPVLHDPEGDLWGFNVHGPYREEGEDETCPCLCDDGWYSHMPDDNFFCGNCEPEEGWL